MTPHEASKHEQILAAATERFGRNGYEATKWADLGLDNSIWGWYRPNGVVALTSVADFFIDRVLAMIGLTPDAAHELRMAA